MIAFTMGMTISNSNMLGESRKVFVYACATSEECQTEITEAQNKRAQLQAEQKALEAKSASTEEQIKNIIGQIAAYNAEITAVTVELTNLANQIKQLTASIVEKDNQVKKRLVQSQLAYETDYALAFIANSTSITDMLERTNVVNSLTSADRDLINTLQAQQDELKKAEEKQKTRQKELETLLEEQKKLQEAKQKELEAYLAAKRAAEEGALKALRDEELSQAQLASIEAAKRGAPSITSGTALQNEKAAFAYFVGQGYTKEAAAGIIGNYYAESGMDPTISQIGGGPGRGIGQWGYNADGGRYNQLLAWAAQNGLNPQDLGTQLAWTVKEMISYGMEPTMKSIRSIEEATTYFGRVWERPACLECSLSTRISYAKQAYARNAHL